MILSKINFKIVILPWNFSYIFQNIVTISFDFLFKRDVPTIIFWDFHIQLGNAIVSNLDNRRFSLHFNVAYLLNKY